jgi:mono/diheme cytochrome c family protein
MASWSYRAGISKAGPVLGFLAAVAACTSQPSRPPSPPVEAGVDLPPGEGREILVSSCLACHDLGGLALFKGYYDRDNWRDLVLTMQANGATIDAGDVEVLAEYLERHFGPDATP